jgi:RNA polymerase sigma-70 factor (ECF subfamily)
MPPLVEWYSGIDAIREFLVWAAGSGQFRFIPTRANGRPAFGIYAGGAAAILHVLEIDAGQITAMTSFMNPALFEAFGLPATVGDS